MLAETSLVLVIIPELLLFLASPTDQITQRPEFRNHENLKSLLRNNKTEEAVALAKVIQNNLKSTSAFNLALSLDQNGEGAEALKITEELFRNLNNNENNLNTFNNMTANQTMNAVKVEMDIWEKIFKESKENNEIPELVELGDNLTEMQVRKLLLNLYWKLDKKDEMLSIVKKTASLHQIMKALSISNISYSLTLKENGDELSVYFYRDGIQIKKISVENSVLDLSILPTTVKSISLRNTEVVRSRGIDLPNLKSLHLYSMPSVSFLSHLKSVPVSDIYFSRTPFMDLSNLPSSTKDLSLVYVDKIVVTGKFQLPDLKNLKIFYTPSPHLSFFNSFPLNEVYLQHTTADLSLLPPTLQKLRLHSADLENITKKLEFPNLKYLKVSDMPSPLSHFQSLKLNELELDDTPLDLSLLPPTLQKLSLTHVEVVNTSPGEFHIPSKLTHLRLFRVSSDYWPLFRPLPLTHLEIQLGKELNVDLMPPTIKNIKMIIIRDEEDSSEEDTPTVVVGVKQLEKLSLSGFTLEEVQEYLKNLHPKQLVISRSPNDFLPSQLIRLLNSELKTIAVGIVGWDSLPESEMSLLSDDEGNKTSQYYLIESGKGRPIQFEEFFELSEIY